MNSDPEEPFPNPEEAPRGMRGVVSRLGLALAIGASLASVLVPDGWPADLAMGLALAGFIMLLAAGR
jgi:hypothetical protein